MKVTIIGAGYVGCVTAACLAKLEHEVLVIDTDPFKVAEITAGRSPVLEPGLSDLLREQVSRSRLRATTPCDSALTDADAIVVCVSTPSLKAGGVDTRPLQRVFASIAKVAPEAGRPITVVVRSTVAPGRLRQIVKTLPQRAQRNIHLVVNPEFLRETTAIQDFEHPPFILLGSDEPAGAKIAMELHVGIEAPIRNTDIESALLVKYASNAFHALKVAFANEVGAIGDALGANPAVVMSIFSEDRILNVSAAYLRPGFAFGGSCLPKDVRALVALGRELSEPLPLLKGALESNRHRIDRAADRIESTGARKVAMLGLSFKRGTDDLRESPYLLLAAELVQRGLELTVYDPDIAADRLVGANRQYVSEYLPGLPQMLVTSIDEAADGAEALIVCKRVSDQGTLRAVASQARHVFDLEHVL